MEKEQWKADLAKSLRSVQDAERLFPLTPEERAFFREERAGRSLPFQVTEYYASLASDNPKDPVRRQCIPTSAEYVTRPGESGDPLAEQRYTVSSRLVRRYHDRVLFKVNDSCAVYCRHCFRRDFTGGTAGAVTKKELEDICRYIRNAPDVREVLLSGGDPLLLDDERIHDILETLRRSRPDIMFRLATRTPVTLPSRITAGLAGMLSRYFPLWIVTQFNHPVELTSFSINAVSLLRRAGIPCLNQTVLLRGVNDDAKVLSDLFRGLLNTGVKPYYLFQGDLARGTGRFRTSLETGWHLMEELGSQLSGPAMPVYAVDLPGGGGKISLGREHLIRETDGGFVFRGFDGNSYTYPKE